MNELIDSFISDMFTNEYIDNIRKSFSLFEAFEHQNAYSGMIDAITDEGIESRENRADRFSAALTQELDYVVGQHLIALTPEATIADKILILDALYRVQHLENYVAYESILSTEDDTIDKMAAILEELTTVDQGYFLTILQSVDDRAIKLLSDFVNHKTVIKNEPIKPEILNRVKLVTEVLGKETLGAIMIDGGMKPGYPIELYLPYVENDIVDEVEDSKTVLNILSVLYMADIDETNILNLYREVGERIFKSVQMVGRMESQVLTIINKVTEARNIQNEKARLLKESPALGSSE